MLQSVDGIRAIASKTRNDFERGVVTDDEIVAAAVACGAVHQIGSYSREKADNVKEAGGRLVRVELPLYNPERFPEGHCDIASILLKHRIDGDNLLQGNRAILVHGGYGEDREAYDTCSYYDRYHAFLDIGSTLLGSNTIVDITADQFDDYDAPAVYVGPIRHPWTAEPRIEQETW